TCHTWPQRPHRASMSSPTLGLDMRGILVLAEDVAEHLADLPQRGVAARRLDHRLHDVGVALARAPHTGQPLAKAAVVSPGADGADARDLLPLRSHVDLQ